MNNWGLIFSFFSVNIIRVTVAEVRNFFTRRDSRICRGFFNPLRRHFEGEREKEAVLFFAIR